MAKSLGTLDKWRDYFLTANSDIFDIIERAIMVAALDCPKEFKLRRDRIAELLFSCKKTKCFCCDEVHITVPGDGGDEEEQKVKCNSEIDSKNEVEAGRSKESKVNCTAADGEDDDDDQGEGAEMETNVNHHVSNYSYGEAEALTAEIEEESQILGEVLRIKEILDNSEDESDSVLFDSLRRLQLMGLSVEILKATEIGKSVKSLRKHGSEKIRRLSKTLVDGWMAMVEEWMAATAALANVISGEGGTPESVKKSDLVDDEEEGLPSPPLDEGALFLTEAAPMELSGFFEGMDEDGNTRNCGEFNKNRQNGRKPSLENKNVPKQKQQLPKELNTPPKNQKVEQPKKQADVVKPNKPLLGVGSGPGRPTKPIAHPKVNYEMKSQKKSDRGPIEKRESAPQQNKMRNSDEAAVLVKLEASKRKLQERYQEAENAKRQRTIQVMELHDIPKQALVHKNPHMRPGSHGRHWANGRR